MVVIVGLIAYPFVSAIYAQLPGEARRCAGRLGRAGQNYQELLFGRDVGGVFRQSVVVSIIFVTAAQVMKLILGLSMALLLNEQFPYRMLVRGIFFIPWAIPTLIAGLTWKWMYDGRRSGCSTCWRCGSG